ncbi:DUF2303 family protein [uncultured Parasutterella sp.]|uniref:DUF2303 family protein n=1 Tax=uncultured Parasutterella sp. TaxID=1263098 RepID=UPI0025946133|nr:DUF2303 family protein [uncultured Parasutterella sp.]
MDETTTSLKIDAKIPNNKRVPFSFSLEGVPFIVLPESEDSWSLHCEEALLAAPKRTRGQTKINDIDSFLAFVKDYAGQYTSMYIKADLKNLEFLATAIFNDNKKNFAQWADHKALYKPVTSTDWDAWISRNKLRTSQEEFALFLDEHIEDIVGDDHEAPSAATVLEAVTNLYDCRNVTFGSKVSLSNGMTSFEYKEQDGGSGRLQVPTEFLIGIPVFADGAGYKIRAKLRYKIDRGSGALCLWYELQRVEKVFEKAILTQMEKLNSLSDLMPIYYGSEPITGY